MGGYVYVQWYAHSVRSVPCVTSLLYYTLFFLCGSRSVVDKSRRERSDVEQESLHLVDVAGSSLLCPLERRACREKKGSLLFRRGYLFLLPQLHPLLTRTESGPRLFFYDEDAQSVSGELSVACRSRTPVSTCWLASVICPIRTATRIGRAGQSPKCVAVVRCCLIRATIPHSTSTNEPACCSRRELPTALYSL